jgi:acetyl-CoA synthetase
LQNCIDRHLAKRGEKTAIVLNQMTLRSSSTYITYNLGNQRVCKWQTYCVKKKRRSSVYLFTDDSEQVSILACARIGFHSVVLQDFPGTGE